MLLENSNDNLMVETPWPSDQSLKVSKPRSGFESHSTKFLQEEFWVSISVKDELCKKLEKMLTKDLQHDIRNTVGNESHKTTQNDAERVPSGMNLIGLFRKLLRVMQSGKMFRLTNVIQDSLIIGWFNLSISYKLIFLYLVTTSIEYIMVKFK